MSLTRLLTLTTIVWLLAVLSITTGMTEDRREQKIGDWGTVVDPDTDCEFELLDKKLQITVPGTNHNLHPARGLNAPRVLKKIRGDFTVQVKVTADFMPGKTSATEGGQPFNGAGLLLWDSEKNYLRIERNCWWRDDVLYCYPPLMEYYRESRYTGANEQTVEATYFKGKSTWLKGKREGKNMTVSISHDGKDWTDVKTFSVELPEELQVGVDAVNASDGRFIVVYEDFQITVPEK